MIWYALLIAAVAVERIAELVVSQRNLSWSRTRGGVEFGAGHYPAMVALHTGLLVGCLVEAMYRPFLPALGWPMLAVVLAAQGLRWWCITTLGRQWNTRVVVIPGPGAAGPGVADAGTGAHYASPEKRSAGSIVVTVAGNPLIWACAVGLALNVTHIPLPKLWHEVADALGRSSLAIGLLVTGAGLHLEGLFRPSLAASVTVFLKLMLMPVIAVALALQFGITGSNLAVVTICSAVPTASSAYVLARQMGGDAPLLAQIITLQTILAAVTMPIAIALVS